MEIDLSKFSQTVQSLGGLKGVIEKKRWHKVADAMKIPKSAQDRVTKLDDIYCQFLLAYDTLSQSRWMTCDFRVFLIDNFVLGEKQELLDEVQTEWDKRQVDFSSDDEDNFDENEECVTKVNLY
jgi:protein Jumonji